MIRSEVDGATIMQITVPIGNFLFDTSSFAKHLNIQPWHFSLLSILIHLTHVDCYGMRPARSDMTSPTVFFRGVFS